MTPCSIHRLLVLLLAFKSERSSAGTSTRLSLTSEGIEASTGCFSTNSAIHSAPQHASSYATFFMLRSDIIPSSSSTIFSASAWVICGHPSSTSTAICPLMGWKRKHSSSFHSKLHPSSRTRRPTGSIGSIPGSSCTRVPPSVIHIVFEPPAARFTLTFLYSLPSTRFSSLLLDLRA